MSERIEQLKRIADQYQVNVTFNCETEEKNNGSYAGNEMWLGEFDDIDLLTVAFFHELAHCLSKTVLVHRKYCSSRLADEGFAWEYGFELAARYGYTWDINHEVYRYAEQRLRTYTATNCLNCKYRYDKDKTWNSMCITVCVYDPNDIEVIRHNRPCINYECKWL